MRKVLLAFVMVALLVGGAFAAEVGHVAPVVVDVTIVPPEEVGKVVGKIDSTAIGSEGLVVVGSAGSASRLSSDEQSSLSKSVSDGMTNPKVTIVYLPKISFDLGGKDFADVIVGFNSENFKGKSLQHFKLNFDAGLNGTWKENGKLEKLGDFVLVDSDGKVVSSLANVTGILFLVVRVDETYARGYEPVIMDASVKAVSNSVVLSPVFAMAEETSQPRSSSGGGCNAGFAGLAVVAMLGGLLIRGRK